MTLSIRACARREPQCFPCSKNLFGLAVGPFVGGALSDAWGLQTALAVMPAFGVLAALSFWLAARSYESDMGALRAEEIRSSPACTQAGCQPIAMELRK
ncbi:hypothetical protein ACTMU2_03315 [Cupriavidus basilensis]